MNSNPPIDAYNYTTSEDLCQAMDHGMDFVASSNFQQRTPNREGNDSCKCVTAAGAVIVIIMHDLRQSSVLGGQRFWKTSVSWNIHLIIS